MERKYSPEYFLYDISHLSKKGRGLTSKGVEIAGTLPGEEVLAESGGKKKAYLRQLINRSSLRTAPRCAHCPDCGGCAIQQMQYEAQLNLKQKYVEDLFKEPVRSIIGCSNPFQYRNKMEFSFSQNQKGDHFLGLMLSGSRGRVINLNECHLVSSWFLKVLKEVRSFWIKSSLRAYHHSSDTGHLRTLTLREAIFGKGKMVMLTVSGNPKFAIPRRELDQFIAILQKCCPSDDLSVFLQIQQLSKGRPTQFFEMLLSGPDHITETLKVCVKGNSRKLDFKISPTSFFQPNTKQAEILYSKSLSMIDNLQNSLILDLYCGGATLGLSVAPFAKKVIGIEINPHSIFDAGWNCEANKIQNFTPICGDVEKILSSFKESPDVIIVDPPRSGLTYLALKHLIGFCPKEILYISCNPLTQFENITLLKKSGYVVTAIQPIDQFPHTMHIENIVHLRYTG